jgi:hypothetical protein
MTKKQLIKLDKGICLLSEYLDNFSTPEGNPQYKKEYKILTQCLAIIDEEMENTK